jgi:uncharacterized tellurite resistance protein B-like protein
MFGSIKAFISDFVGEASRRGAFEQRDRLITIAALLVRIATVHCEMSQTRRAKLHDILRSCYGLDDITATELTLEADAIARAAVDLYRFTRRLNDVLDDGERRRVVQMMWEIVYADRGVNEFEENIIWRASDLLGVSTRQRVELRQRIAARIEALAPAKLADYPIMASSARTGD